MKKLLTIASIFFALYSYGQNFYFPKEYQKDNITLGKFMPVLAKQVIAVYKEGDRKVYFDNLCDLQMTAEQYAEANRSLDSVRSFFKTSESDTNSTKGIGFQEQAFASAKLRQAEMHVSFNVAYTFTFNSLFDALPAQSIPDAREDITFNSLAIKENHDKLNKLLNNQSGKDSISFDDAKKLCRAYNSYNVYSQVAPLSKLLLAKQDDKRFIIEDSVLIKTRDGAIISAVVVRKKGVVVKQPAIFIFNIYIGTYDKERAEYCASKGYVGVVANTRGKGLSPQEIEPFEHDANDAYDIIDWISKQVWSNGKVGMVGGSYLGFSQWAAVKKIHPALKTLIPQVAEGPGIDFPMLNNVFFNGMLKWIHWVTNNKNTDDDDFNNEKHWDSTFIKWYANGKSFRSLDTIEGRPNKIFQRWLMHPGYDTYWQNMIPYKTEFAKINIPVLTITGYFDGAQSGAMYYFEQHYLYNKHAEHYLVIGPYDHVGPLSEVPSSKLWGYTIDSVANINFYDLTFQWFDYILKDSARPALLKDKISYEVMGANEWKHVPSLSKMNNDTINFYLSNVRVARHYKLDTQAPSNIEFIRQEVDLKDRSDTSNPPIDLIDSSLDATNGLSFISAPFAKSFEINGSIVGELKASINKKDMDILLNMYELMPDGKYFRVLPRYYITRASYTKNRSQRQLLRPGKIETVPVNNAYFTSKKISAGSRLIVVLGINNNFRWQINYGTGKDVSDETIDDAKIPLQIKWYTNSTIRIPVCK